MDLEAKNVVGKCFHYCVRLPVSVVLKVTVPPPSEVLWDRRFASLSPLGATVFLLFFYRCIAV